MFDRSRTFARALTPMIGAMLLMASLAQAAPKYTPSQYPATVEGSQVSGDHLRIVLGGNREFICETASVSGVIASKGAAETGSLTLAPVIGKCGAEVLGGEVPLTVQMNSCHFRFQLDEEAGGSIAEEGWEVTGSMYIGCEVPGDKIVVRLYETPFRHEAEQPLCVYSIAEQGPAKSLDFKLDGAGTTLSVGMTVSGITMVKTAGLPLCGAASQAIGLGGTLALQTFDSGGSMITGEFDTP